MPDPKEIWLQPWCDECENAYNTEGRQWCKDNVWGECDAIDCGEKSVRYVLAGDG